jgi:hypothetical protein
MTAATFTDATARLKAVAVRIYDRSEDRRRALLELAEDLEGELIPFLDALGRIAIGTKTVLAHDSLTPAQLRQALKRCVDIAEAAIGGRVVAANDS